MQTSLKRSRICNLYGSSLKRDYWYEDVKVSLSPEVDVAKVNSKFIAVILETSAGGSFSIINHETTGRQFNHNTFSGNSGSLTDIQLSPFDDNILATSSEDALIMLWNVSGPRSIDDAKSHHAELEQHVNKVTSILFNPTVADCLVSVSTDMSLILWDLKKLEPRRTMMLEGDFVQSICWNYNGSLLATTSRDKQIRMLDVRADKVVSQSAGHTGTKMSRVTWLGDNSYFATTGFTRLGERQIFTWDMRNMNSPIDMVSSFSGSGALHPLYDESLNILYTAGRGDSSIECYEFCDNSKLNLITSFKTNNSSLRDICLYPKSCCNINEVEIAKILQVHSNSLIPCSFKIPIRSKAFCQNLYSNDNLSSITAITLDQYMEGINKYPINVNTEPDKKPHVNIEPDKKPHVKSETKSSVIGVNEAILYPPESKKSDDNTSLNTTSVGGISINNTNVADTSINNTSVVGTIVYTKNVVDTSINTTSVADTSINTKSVTDTSINTKSVADTSINTTSAGDASINTTNVDTTSINKEPENKEKPYFSIRDYMSKVCINEPTDVIDKFALYSSDRHGPGTSPLTRPLPPCCQNCKPCSPTSSSNESFSGVKSKNTEYEPTLEELSQRISKIEEKLALIEKKIGLSKI